MDSKHDNLHSTEPLDGDDGRARKSRFNHEIRIKGGRFTQQQAGGRDDGVEA